MEKIIVCCRAVIATILLVFCPTLILAGDEDRFVAVEVAGDNSQHGIYDPSIEYAGGDTGWMTYSSIDWPKVETRLAKTADKGASWTYVKIINPVIEGEIVHEGKKVSGVWRNEVSALVHDPGDPGREWKVFWHRYFNRKPFKDRDRMFAYGWIGYRYAAVPEGPWSEEIALFGAGDFLSEPYKVMIDLRSLHPELNGYRVFTEPAVLSQNGVLYLSLEASRSPSAMGEWETRKIFLLASEDHGKTWQYRGCLVDYRDSAHLGYVVLTGASLFAVDGKVFLMATPSGSLTNSYKNEDGMYLFEFADIRKAKLKRDGQNHLIIHKYIKPSAKEGGHGGQGDFDQRNTNGGIVIGQIKKPNLLGLLLGGKTKPFNVFSTREGVN